MTEASFSSRWEMCASSAQAYERYIVPAWMERWAMALVEAGRVGAGERVLDVACGTGVVARKAAGLAGEAGLVVGVDAEEEMLGAARAFASKQCGAAIDWQQADVTRLPFGTASFDAVLCQQGLQFFPDKAAAVREMRRVLVSGGRLAVSVWRALDRFPLFLALAEVLGSRFGEAATAILYASSAFSDREALRALAVEAGFRDIRIRIEARVARYPSLAEFLPGYLSVFPVAAAIGAMPEAERQELFHLIETSLHDFMDDDGLAAPMESHVLTAVK